MLLNYIEYASFECIDSNQPHLNIEYVQMLLTESCHCIAIGICHDVNVANRVDVAIFVFGVYCRRDRAPTSLLVISSTPYIFVFQIYIQ